MYLLAATVPRGNHIRRHRESGRNCFLFELRKLRYWLNSRHQAIGPGPEIRFASPRPGGRTRASGFFGIIKQRLRRSRPDDKPVRQASDVIGRENRFYPMRHEQQGARPFSRVSSALGPGSAEVRVGFATDNGQPEQP